MGDRVPLDTEVPPVMTKLHEGGLDRHPPPRREIISAAWGYEFQWGSAERRNESSQFRHFERFP